MAEGRMLKKAISMSRRLANLETDKTRLIYLMILPHLDIEGRFSGDPDVIRGVCMPRLCSISTEHVQSALVDMSKVGMIDWYESDGDWFLEYRKFYSHQTLRRDRERPSVIPEPTGLLPDTAGTPPPQGKGREVKLKEEKLKSISSGRAKKLPYADTFDECYAEHPRKEGRKRAYRAYAARRKEGVPAKDLLEATKIYAAASNGKEKQFIRLPSTFYGPDEWWKEALEGKLEANNEVAGAQRQQFKKRCIVCAEYFNVKQNEYKEPMCEKCR